MGEWRYRTTILDLGTRWRWMVSFTPLPFYTQGRSPTYPLCRRLGGSQSQSGHCGEEKKSLALAGNQTPAIQPKAHHSTDWAIPDYFRLLYFLILFIDTIRSIAVASWEWGLANEQPETPDHMNHIWHTIQKTLPAVLNTNFDFYNKKSQSNKLWKPGVFWWLESILQIWFYKLADANHIKQHLLCHIFFHKTAMCPISGPLKGRH
jgi:hypothetical protein